MSLLRHEEHHDLANGRELGEYAAAGRLWQTGEFWRPASSPPRRPARGVARSTSLSPV